MTAYVQTTDFSAKDSLATGDPEKVITGADVDVELASIASAIGSKLDASGGTDLAVADGGTGASTAAAARSNLGLGTISTQDANNVAITGGAISGITDLAVADGGTGSSTAAGARTNLGLGSLATASSVTQSLLSTSATVNSFGSGGGSGFTTALTGGSYSWWTMSEGGQNLTLGTAGDPGLGSISGRSQDGSSQTVTLRERYVTASPPYNDGPLFVYLTYESGVITGISIAPDPTWANHGPTNIAPERYDAETGKKFRTTRTIEGVPLVLALKNPKTLAAYLNGDLKIDESEVEITLDFKDSDKKVAPHPMFQCAPGYHAGRTYVLLDGQSNLVQRLHDLYLDADAGVVHDLIKGGYIQVDNQPIIDRTLPSTLLRCAATFKLS